MEGSCKGAAREMRIISTLLSILSGLFIAGLIAVICEDEERRKTDYDSDEDGGFMDDWRWP